MVQQQQVSSLPRATSYHRLPVRLFNGFARIMRRFGLLHADLSEAGLIAAARKATGLHFFGNVDFVPQMRVALWALEHEANLNPLGRYLTRQSLVRLLKNRLYAEDYFSRHPSIRRRKLKPPLIVMGLGRSGTTTLHRSLAQDPQFSFLPAWESFNPVPWPGVIDPNKPDPRAVAIEQGLKVVLYLTPQIQQVHPLSPYEADEELGLLEHAFASQLFEVQKHVPTFAKYIITHSQLYAYKYMVELLRLVEWVREKKAGEPLSKPWVLKTPQHMQDMDSLIKVFPDARYVFIHRDPRKVVGSLCSTAWNSSVRDTDYVDPMQIGRDWSAMAEREVKKTLKDREKIPQEHYVDVLYADMMADHAGTLRKIYDALGYQYTDELEGKHQEWLEKNKQNAHGKHRYQLEDFGLSVEEIEKRFAFYYERFNIPTE